MLKPGKNIVAIRVLKTKPQADFLANRKNCISPLPTNRSFRLRANGKGVSAPLSITSVLWYQGEQNSDRGFQYRKILPVMIEDWRKLFGQSDFPFYIVSLPAFQHRRELPTDDTWAETRESQALTASRVRNSCLAVTIDTGDPDNLQEVHYAWQSNPVATLFNGAGLPAAPFRTDTWPGITESHRPY